MKKIIFLFPALLIIFSITACSSPYMSGKGKVFSSGSKSAENIISNGFGTLLKNDVENIDYSDLREDINERNNKFYIASITSMSGIKTGPAWLIGDYFIPKGYVPTNGEQYIVYGKADKDIFKVESHKVKQFYEIESPDKAKSGEALRVKANFTNPFSVPIKACFTACIPGYDAHFCYGRCPSKKCPESKKCYQFTAEETKQIDWELTGIMNQKNSHLETMEWAVWGVGDIGLVWISGIKHIIVPGRLVNGGFECINRGTGKSIYIKTEDENLNKSDDWHIDKDEKGDRVTAVNFLIAGNILNTEKGSVGSNPNPSNYNIYDCKTFTK